MPYQPQRVNGRDVGQADRDCGSRYEAIRDHLRAHHPHGPVHVLDLGAYAGYFAVRLVEDFDAHVVAVDDHPPLRQVASDRITVINHRLDADQIDGLGDFDAVLLLSVLHHTPDWPRILEVVCRRSTLLYLETPDPSEHLPRAAAHTSELAAAAECLGGQVLARTAGYRSTIPRKLRAICLR